MKAKFTDLSHGRNVTISIRSVVLSMFKEQIVGRRSSNAKLRELAWRVASMPEEELCITKNG